MSTVLTPEGVRTFRCYYQNDFRDKYDASAELDDDGEWCSREEVEAAFVRIQATLAAREEECKRHAPLPDREALSLFVESALNVPPKDYLRKGTQAEYIADALLAWLKSSTASQRGADE